MASGSGGQDPAWRYCTPLEGHKNGTICNYCGLSIKSDGITRLKFHLSHTDSHSNTKKCQNVPPKVKQEMKQLKISDMGAETDEVAKNNFLDLLEISAKFGDEEENQLFQ